VSIREGGGKNSIPSRTIRGGKNTALERRKGENGRTARRDPKNQGKKPRKKNMGGGSLLSNASLGPEMLVRTTKGTCLGGGGKMASSQLNVGREKGGTSIFAADRGKLRKEEGEAGKELSVGGGGGGRKTRGRGI